MKDIKETLKTFATFMMDQTNISKYLPSQFRSEGDER